VHVPVAAPIAAPAAMNAAVAASVTSASIPCGRLGGCSTPAPGAARAAEVLIGANASVIRPLATIHATATAIGPVTAAAARVATAAP
jgi:hypothetical protein